MRDLEKAFHDAEGLFDKVEHYAANGVGRVRGNTAHVKKMLNRIEDCIYNLQNDLVKLDRLQSARKPVNVYRPPVTPVKYRQAYDSGRSAYGGRSINVNSNRGYGRSAYGNGYKQRSGVGISFGGGSSRITFKF